MTRDRIRNIGKSLLVGLVLVLAAGTFVEGKASTLVLKLSWAKKFRNQLSIDAQVTVLALNAGKEDDGDSHGGSRVNAAGLPMVAEILNGTAPAQAAARAKLAPGGQPKRAVYGAWRLWFEHPPPGGATQCQILSSAQPAAVCDQHPHGADSNPSHSFEIHPVFAVDGIAIGRSSLVLTADNESVKDTDKAFADYTGPNKMLTIVRSSTALTLTMISVQNNYVRMKFRVTHTRTATTRQKDGTVDGGFVLADSLSSADDHDVLRSDARIFYFKDSLPGDALDSAAVGAEFTVIGMPRMDLDAVLRGSDGKQTTSFKVPFEFIIVAMG